LVIHASIDRTHIVDFRYRLACLRRGGRERPNASLGAIGIGNSPTSGKRSATTVAQAH